MVLQLYKVYAIIAFISLCNCGKSFRISVDADERSQAMEPLTNLSTQLKKNHDKLNSIQLELTDLKDLFMREIKLLHVHDSDSPEDSETAVTTVEPTQQKIYQTHPRSCTDALHANAKDGVYPLYGHLPDIGFTSFDAYCMHDTNENSDWTIIQRRQDGSVDFLRDWNDYKKGFINVSDSEFFLGLEKINALINNVRPLRTELWIQMVDNEGSQRFAKYDNFVLGDEHEKFALKSLGNYYGNAGDSLRYHEGKKFSTIDKDNDNSPENCAKIQTGAWWYSSCHESNLNGKYGDNTYAKGITWEFWHGHSYSLKSVFMAIRSLPSK